ncbi:hypothetical protein LNTAR_15012, partial [Lentisphaera araneosa HTCC2155]
EFLLRAMEDEEKHRDIEITKDLRGSHPLITKYTELYNKEKEEAKRNPWSNYFHPPSGYGLRNITSFSRAKLILNTIFKQAEKRGYIVTESNRYQGVDLIVHDQKIAIELHENCHQKLTLKIISYCPNFQSSWSDRKVQ